MKDISSFLKLTLYFLSVRLLHLFYGFEIDILLQGILFYTNVYIYVKVDDATAASRNSAGIVNGAITFSRACTLV
jgi:hypothetical protein